MHSPTVPNSGSSARSRADWFGFLFFASYALFLMWRAPRIGLLMLPTIVHELLVVTSFLMRGAAKARLRTLGARLAAYAGTFLLPAFMVAATTYRPLWLRTSESHVLLAVRGVSS